MIHNTITSIGNKIREHFVHDEEAEPPSDPDPGLVEFQEKVSGFFEKRIHQVMISRTKMVTIESRALLSEAIALIRDKGHSRIPVITHKNPDEIVGVLYAKDIFSCWQEIEERSVSSIMKQAIYVSYMQPLHQVLSDFKARRIHIAVVVDEYGGVGGMVTAEDIMEELFGEMEDEHDLPEIPAVTLENGFTNMEGEYSLEDFNKLYQTTFEKEGIETIGGYICHISGRIPQAEECIDLEGIPITILEGDDRHIKRFRIHTSPVNSPVSA